jgi:thioredoxin 1
MVRHPLPFYPMNLQEFQQQLKSHSNPVIVDLWASWCIPCRRTRPVLESIGKEYDGRVDLLFVNADEHPDLLKELGIYGVPTVLITRSGNILRTFPGAHSRENYRVIFKALANPDDTVKMSISTFDRFLRLFAGLTLGIAGLSSGAWSLVLLGGMIAFLGVYDRCPLWRAFTGHLFKRERG